VKRHLTSRGILRRKRISGVMTSGLLPKDVPAVVVSAVELERRQRQIKIDEHNERIGKPTVQRMAKVTFGNRAQRRRLAPDQARQSEA